MKRFTSKRFTLKHRVMVIAIASSMGACASTQRSRTLQAAQSRLDSPRARQLEATQPQLVQQANAFAKAARRAEESGDVDTANLKAQQSIQRFETAISLDERRATEAKMRAMETATESLSAKVEDLDRERDALAKFRDAEMRFAAVEAELGQIRADDKSERAEAQRAIVAARRKQAEAVGAKAPLNAADQYNSAATLLDSALAALNASLHTDARQLAEQARDGFDQAMVAAKAESENQVAGAADAERAAGEKARMKAGAKDAIEAAEVARASAVASRLAQRDRARFQQGETYLAMARSRFEDGDFEQTVERAKAATAAYSGTAKAGAADVAIQAAEEARGRVIGMGLADAPDAREGDYTLKLARDARSTGEEARAVTLAKKALSLYQGVRPQRAMPAGGALAAPAATGAPAGATPVDLRAAFQQYEVERALVRVRHAHADALASGKDAVCPSLFRGFEAFIELAEDRYAAGNHADAMQYATRAGERLAQCNPLNEALSPTTPGAGPLKAAAKSPAAPTQTPAERRAQQKAESALVIAKRLMIRAQTRKVDPLLLEEPELLLQEAQRWYAREAFAQADGLADEATKQLRKIRMPTADQAADKAEAEEKAGEAALNPAAPAGAKAATPTAPVAADAAKDTTPKAGLLPRKGTAVAAATPTCAPLQPQLNTVRQARGVAASRATTPEKQAQYVRALKMLASVEGLVKEDRCAQAEPFLAEVNRLFDDIFKPVDTPVTPSPALAKGEDAPPAKAAAPAAAKVAETPTCADLERPVQAAYVAQGVASARITDAQARRRFERGVADLVLTERAIDAGKCVDAKGHLDRAVASFDTLAGARPADAAKAPVAAQPTASRATVAQPDVAQPVAVQAAPTVAPVAVDPAASAAADKAIARAESLQRRARGRQASSTYQTGAQLLGKARDLAAVGRTGEASAVADQAAFAFSTAVDDTGDVAGAPDVSGAPPSEWKPVYAMILDTLVLRDRARPVVKTDAEQMKFQSAMGFMGKSQVAWRDKDYVAAKRFTEAAKVDLEAVIALAETRLKTPVPEAAPAVDPKADAKADAARARLRAVGVLRGRCMERDCKQTHAVEWAAADAAITSANAALAAGDWVEAKAQADAAHASLTDVLNRPTFFIPADTKGVRRVGNQLMLTPTVTFTTGGGAIEPSALPTIAALADVLKANDAVVERLRIVGHTDSRGSERTNLALSERRANTVRTALVDLGVAPSKVVAAGMGEANPIDSNTTAAGRERNRRVEFLLTVNQ